MYGLQFLQLIHKDGLVRRTLSSTIIDRVCIEYVLEFKRFYLTFQKYASIVFKGLVNSTTISDELIDYSNKQPKVENIYFLEIQVK